MIAIYKRELRAYFTSMTAYIYLAVYLFLSGLMFFLTNIVSATSQMTQYFSNVVSWAMFIIPLLTMRMFAEDRRQKTDILLLSSPVSIGGMVVGKYLAALTVFLGGTAVTLIYPAIVAACGTPAVGEIVCGYIGYILVCAAMIAVGALMSALTDNQIVAAVSTLAVIIASEFIGNLAAALPFEWAASALMWLSPVDRFYTFANGIFSVPSLVYYVSITALFLFLTCQCFERRRFR